MNELLELANIATENMKIIPLLDLETTDTNRQSIVFDTDGYGALWVIVLVMNSTQGVELYLRHSDQPTGLNESKYPEGYGHEDGIEVPQEDKLSTWFWDIEPSERFYQLKVFKHGTSREAAFAVLHRPEQQSMTD